VERDSADLEAIVTADSELERVAGGFEFTEGPVWSPEGALLFSSPNTIRSTGPTPRSERSR
jgi:gluconolactonase